VEYEKFEKQPYDIQNHHRFHDSSPGHKAPQNSTKNPNTNNQHQNSRIKNCGSNHHLQVINHSISHRVRALPWEAL